jgi:tetratricopeptide (TPR) repeat protein
VSSTQITSQAFVLFLAAATALIFLPAQTHAQSTHPAESMAPRGDPAEIFRHGQEALQRGQLEVAERDFRQVLQLDPQSGAAYSNLGVVYMRRKQWDKALGALQKAERLMPGVAGIRLNIGLAYYRQNEFLKAIPPFEAVLREQPGQAQARYLLGLCYFFASRWADAVNTLEPLWAEQSNQIPYLYVLSNAAHRAGKKELDERAVAQLTRMGNDSPEYHLFAGKYHLNLDQYDLALADFEAAAKANPKLPFVHFNMGLAYVKKQEYAAAKNEFLKDAAIEPDMALNYDQLGNVYWLMQDDVNAEKSYREALRRDPRLVDSRLGLAKIYEKQGKHAAALAEADAAVKFDPERTDAHYLRGQALLHMGRKDEARKEMEIVGRAGRDSEGRKQSSPVPSPELLGDSQ